MPYQTQVPAITFSSSGVQVPTQAQILAGVQADMNAAFGGNLNQGLTTPQGQLATSETAVLAAAYAAFLYVVNSVDPAYASGRFQDAIGRIYFMTRLPPQPTVLQVSCAGLTGLSIPAGALVTDVAGNVYACTTAGAIPAGGAITLPFACTVTGAVAVPSSVTIYQAIQGWDSATLVSGAAGSPVENRAAFESRRQNMVAANSVNQNAAVLGSLLGVSGVTSAYVTDNPNKYPIASNPAVAAVGSISGTLMTIATGTGILVGQYVSGQGVADGTYIQSFAGGTGGPGTYNISISQNVPVGSSLQLGGVQIKSNSLYACVAGTASASAIAQAIWQKKAPGCGYNGATTQNAYDMSPQYGPNGIAYPVTWQMATPVPIFFAINIKNSAGVPSNAAALVQTAIANAFSGADGGLPAWIGVPIVSSRFFAGLTALGPWAQVLSIGMAMSNDVPDATFTASISGTTMTVTSMGSGTITAGMGLVGPNVSGGTTVQQQLGGTPGGAGTYQVSISQNAASGLVNGFLVTDAQEIVGIDTMPVTSAPYITVNLI